jgi:hypothetical protein
MPGVGIPEQSQGDIILGANPGHTTVTRTKLCFDRRLRFERIPCLTHGTDRWVSVVYRIVESEERGRRFSEQ